MRKIFIFMGGGYSEWGWLEYEEDGLEDEGKLENAEGGCFYRGAETRICA